MLKKLINNGPLAVVRLADRSKLDGVLNALLEGGLMNIEITLTILGAVDIIGELVNSKNDKMIIGAGTVVTAKECELVVNAGAEFVVSPVMIPEVISITKKNGLLSMPGCMTPTEILTAWNWGADIVKVFPATSFGPKYFREVLAPFPYLKLMPTGGVSISNVEEWLNAGAVTVAVGSNLIDKKSVDESNFSAIKEKTIELMEIFKTKNNVS